MRSRQEVDFIRLLKRCQKVADKKDWRLERYVDTLSEILDRLRNQNVNQLSRDTLEDYGRKVQFLRGLIETEKLPSAEKRLLAAEFLAPDRDSKPALLITKNKYHDQMREELLLSYRQKHNQTRPDHKKDSDDVHEDITKNLLKLTNDIRENMHAANSIIQKDTETLSRVSSGADLVGMKMQRNTDKLGEFMRKGFQCAIWTALILVTLSFLMIVVFIRLFPKQ